jgi:ArsR family transcriptional regulator, lead/cadmium/zinc/bismuth-responsive transcriptional repressor
MNRTGAGEALAASTLVTQDEIDALCDVRCVHPDKVLAGRALLIPDGEYSSLAGIFAALADPTRAKIVYSILHQELCTCDLAAITGISESAVSQHLAVLRRLRLVRHRRAGKIVYYALDDPHIDALLQICLEHVRDSEGGR